MEPTDSPPMRSDPRTLTIENKDFGFANIEAWLNIIRSYQTKHSGHEVHIVYEGEEIQNRLSLFKVDRPVNPKGFECYVSAPDGNFKDVTKLTRLLFEAAGPDFQKFLTRELHRVLELF